VEAGVNLERIGEVLMELGARDFDGAELTQMVRHELGVEQLKAPVYETRGEIDERHLAGVALQREHRFAEKRPAEMHPV
jgi:hypothetical protein